MIDPIGIEKIAGVKLKYLTALKACPDQPCPNPQKFAPQSRIAYRYVRNKCTENDFVPFPERCRPGCEAHALSFFTTMEKAQARYRSLAEVHDDKGATAIELYGDHIADVEIKPADGLLSKKASGSGHLSLHPTEGSLFADRVATYVRCDYLVEVEN